MWDVRSVKTTGSYRKRRTIPYMMELEGGGKLFFFIQISFSYVSMEKMEKKEKIEKNGKKMGKKNGKIHIEFSDLRNLEESKLNNYLWVFVTFYF